MKILLVGINSKFIHPNVALRLIQKNSTVETRLIEFTIKDSAQTIIDIIEQSPEEVVAFSVYIWNITLIKEILPKLKKRIVLGGPEVSYDSNHYFDFPIEWIIKGEGEQAFEELFAKETPYEKIAGLSYKKDGLIHSNPIEEQSIDALKFANDISFHPSQIQYIETSRGCPFKCSFCMASLEKSVRYFSMLQVYEQLDYVINHNAKTIKFLDRTFNLNITRSIQIIEYIIKHHKPGMSFQFEITGDILDNRILSVIHKAPKDLFRFEIGIQSTYDITNIAVDRKQDTEKLFETIQEIQQVGIVDLHLDLIAGLPFESLTRFQDTFNQTFHLHAKELQLGFLKLLPGTKLKSEQQLHEYVYIDAPYEIIKSKYLTEQDIQTIKSVEEALEHTWNKGYMNHTILALTKENPFTFFLKFDQYMTKHFGGFRVQLNELFSALDQFTNGEFHHMLMLDYLKYHSIKPKRWWNPYTKETRKELLKKFQKSHPSLSLQSLYKYAAVEPGDVPIVAYYHPDEKWIKEMA